MWTKEPPNVGDFKGPRAIYIVRSGKLNYPVPVQVHVGAHRRPSPRNELNFEFCIPELIKHTIWRDQLRDYGMFDGVEWFGPVDVPE